MIRRLIIDSYASMPFDNIKTRMQSIGRYRGSMISVATNMLIKEGVLVFWKATTPRLVRLTVSSCYLYFVFFDERSANGIKQLSSSITFIVYDCTLKLFGNISTRQSKTNAI